MTTEPFRVECAAARHGAPLAALFERAGSACYCRFWHFAGTNNEWLARCAHDPDENRAQMLQALDAGADEMLGAVAILSSPNPAEVRAIGWLKLNQANVVAKLYAQRPYRQLPYFAAAGAGALDRTRVHAIGCFLVDPAWRRRGVARALLAEAVAIARARGASAIEAFPRRGTLLRDDEIWMGPYDLFLEQGFEIVHPVDPYPVLRKSLAL